MEEIIKELEKFSFSKLDAQVYLTIVKNPKINGSQVAKKINISRTSVYASIENLYKRGAIHLIPQTTNNYIAKNPIDFIRKLKKEYIDSADYLEKEFENFEVEEDEGSFYNIKGKKNILEKIKELILEAKKEIYMSTNYDLDDFEKELKIAKKKGVRIILFTFREQEFNKYDLEVYYNDKFKNCKCCTDNIKRNMLVIDCINAFVGSGRDESDYYASFSSNKLFVQVVSEHIHHDIYLLGLERLYGADWYAKLKLGTLHEDGFKSE